MQDSSGENPSGGGKPWGFNVSNRKRTPVDDDGEKIYSSEGLPDEV